MKKLIFLICFFTFINLANQQCNVASSDLLQTGNFTIYLDNTIFYNGNAGANKR